MLRFSLCFRCDSQLAVSKVLGDVILGFAAASVFCALLCAPAGATPQSTHEKAAAAQARFAISFSAELSAAPLDGRVYVVISTSKEPEPRFQISEDEVKSQQILGVDVDGLAPGQNCHLL